MYAPFAAGETITRQGAVAHWLYILVHGPAEIRRHDEERRDAARRRDDRGARASSARWG